MYKRQDYSEQNTPKLIVGRFFSLVLGGGAVGIINGRSERAHYCVRRKANESAVKRSSRPLLKSYVLFTLFYVCMLVETLDSIRSVVLIYHQLAGTGKIRKKSEESYPMSPYLD